MPKIAQIRVAKVLLDENIPQHLRPHLVHHETYTVAYLGWAGLKKGRLQRWRDQRKGRERIPPGIWSAAGKLAREHGVNRVSQAFHLEFTQLKHVAEVSDGNSGEKTKKRVAPDFLELIGSQAPDGRECVLELEGPRRKLRIEPRGAATAEVAGISRALWEMLS